MDEQKHKQHIRKTFDTICGGYDCSALRFFSRAAQRLPDTFAFRGDESVLDVAAGTGIPAMAMAAHLPRGSVTAIDFSEGMLEKGREKVNKAGLQNIHFQAMDMTALTFGEGTFDAANSSFGLFFIEDMSAVLSTIVTTLKPGGALVTTHFLEGSFSPLADRFLNQVEAYGIEVPTLGWMRVATEAQNIELFESAGLTEIEAQTHDVGYFLKDENEWWEVIWNAGYRGLIAGLAPQELEQFRQEHLQEIAELAKPEGIWLDVRVVITRGTAQ